MDTQNVVNWTFYMSRGDSLPPIFTVDWLNGNAWNISKRPLTLEEYHSKPTQSAKAEIEEGNEVYEKRVAQELGEDTTGITERMDGQRRDRTKARQKINQPVHYSWKTSPLPDWIQHPVGVKHLPMRIMIPDNQHTFLRSLAWVLDTSFRYQSMTDWNISRMDWLKQIASDLEKQYYDKYKPTASLLTLQQHLMRSSFDWDDMIRDVMTKGDLKPILEILMDWCDCQFWVWKEESKQLFRWHGRKWAHSPQHCAALPVVIFWMDGSRFQPVVWLDGIPANPKAETLRPLPHLWVQDWESLWVQPEAEISSSDDISVEANQEDSEEEPEQEQKSKTMDIVVPKALKRDTKPFWQEVLRQMGLSDKKRSDKTGKLVDKTIDEMRGEAQTSGIILSRILSK